MKDKAYTINCRAYLEPGDILEVRTCTKQIQE